MKPITKAYEFLEDAASQMKDRAVQRDQASGERSMAQTVAAFNALTGKELSEAEGWEFMILLKMVRGRQGNFRADDYVDVAAYGALLGECSSKVPLEDIADSDISIFKPTDNIAFYNNPSGEYTTIELLPLDRYPL